MRLSDAIDEYVRVRQNSGLGAGTVKVDQQALGVLLVTLGNIQCKSIDYRHGEQFREELVRRGYKAGTFNNYRGIAGRFFDWCVQRRYMTGTAQPKAGLGRAMVYHRAPRRRIDPQDFPRLLECAGDTHPQDRIIVALGLYLFIRMSEIRALEVGRTYLDRGIIEVYQPKTKKWDEMPICEELDGELRRWLKFYTEDQMGKGNGPLRPEWPLVPARVSMKMENDGSGKCGGRPIIPKYGQMNPERRLGGNGHHKVQNALLKFGWEDIHKEGGHTLRRSGARALFDDMVATGEVRDGVLREVMSMLHHSTVSMTEHYLGLSADVEKRNRRLIGKPMFRKPAENVVSLRPVEEA